MKRVGLNLLKELLTQGDLVEIESGRIVIKPNSGKPVPDWWMKDREKGLKLAIVAALDTDVYEYESFSTGRYDKCGSEGVALQFISPITGRNVYVIFNAHLQRLRTVGGNCKGSRLPGKRFRVGRRSSFYKFWKSTSLLVPPSLTSFHDYMGNLRGIWFTASVNDNRMDKNSLRPLSVPARMVRSVFIPDKFQTAPRQMPDNVQTRMPDKQCLQSHADRGLQRNETAGNQNYVYKVISKRGHTGTVIPFPQATPLDDQSIDKWLDEYKGGGSDPSRSR